MSFNSIVEQFQKFSELNTGLKVDLIRAEAVVESLKDWSELMELNDVKDWFLQQQENCTMSFKDIPLFDCIGWSYNEKKGTFEHDSGEFFFVQGVRVTNTKDREVVGGWDQPIVTQVGYNGGILGLLRMKKNGIPYYLIEAKAEPGNPDKVQICPTLQATFSNLKQAHGGKKPKFAEFFETPEKVGGKVVFDQWMSEDGGRLHLKRNKGMIVEVSDIEENSYHLSDTFIWMTLYQLKALIKENSWVSPHIRGIISHL